MMIAIWILIIKKQHWKRPLDNRAVTEIRAQDDAPGTINVFEHGLVLNSQSVVRK